MKNPARGGGGDRARNNFRNGREYPAPAYMPPLVYNWTGFYLGINGGGTWGRSEFLAPFESGSFDTSG